MDDLYNEAKQITDSIVKLYFTLTKLSEDGKRESDEYKNLVGVLKKAVAIEKRKYQSFVPSSQQLEENYNVLKINMGEGGYFTPRIEETISAIRTLNKIDKNKLYTLDGIVLKLENFLEIQSYLDEAYFYQITNYLKEASQEEKGALLKMQGALLAISSNLGDENVVLPKANVNMTDEEMQSAAIYILPRVQKVTDYLMGLRDDQLDSDTILCILYVKACIHLLPPLHEGVVLEEIRNAIGLNRVLGMISGIKNDKICDMLNRIVENDNILMNRK